MGGDCKNTISPVYDPRDYNKSECSSRKDLCPME